jgi:ABC-type nitrate/sulfonate/bicarbonate transport system substrate-binding protein
VKFVALLAAVLVTLGPVAGVAQNAPLAEIDYVTGTASAGDWLTYIADRQGFFRAEGVHVNVSYAGAPPAITQAVATNAANLGNNGIDSWIVAVVHGLSVKVVGSMFAVNTYNLVVSPEIHTWDDLKGKTVMLGTKQDVTAIVLSQMAAPHNLKIDDFSIAIGGNSTARYAALMSGNAQGAILTQPFDLLAQSKGMHVLASGVDAMKLWTSSGIGTNPGWAATHRTLLVKYMRALRRAAQYGYTHKADAIADLIAVVNVDPAIANQTYDDDWTRWHVFDPDQKFTAASFVFMARMQIAMGIMTTAPSYADTFDGSFISERR